MKLSVKPLIMLVICCAFTMHDDHAALRRSQTKKQSDSLTELNAVVLSRHGDEISDVELISSYNLMHLCPAIDIDKDRRIKERTDGVKDILAENGLQHGIALLFKHEYSSELEENTILLLFNNAGALIAKLPKEAMYNYSLSEIAHIKFAVIDHALKRNQDGSYFFIRMPDEKQLARAYARFVKLPQEEYPIIIVTGYYCAE